MSGELSIRLAAVARYVTPGETMVDIGTDHALLPAWLVRAGVVPSAIGVDVATGPLTAARRTAESLDGALEIRQSNGFAAIADGEVRTATVCGMGGQTMAAILTRGVPRLPALTRVVLQPQGAERAVRATMIALGWHCIDGLVVEERHKFYGVECWEPTGDTTVWSDADLRWGRIVRQKSDPLFCRMLVKQLRDAELALTKLLRRAPAEHSDAVQLRKLKSEIAHELDRIGYTPSKNTSPVINTDGSS